MRHSDSALPPSSASQTSMRCCLAYTFSLLQTAPKYIITYLISYTITFLLPFTVPLIKFIVPTELMWIGQNLWTGWARLALLTIKNDVARGTNFVNRHTFREMLYKVIRFFKNLGNMAAEQALKLVRVCKHTARIFKLCPPSSMLTHL